MRPDSQARRRVWDEERGLMNHYAPIYATSLESAGAVYRRERRDFGAWMIERLRAAGLDPKNLSVLDVGCGTGEAIRPLFEAGCRRAVGLDLAEAMLTTGRSSLDGVDWVHGRVEDAPFAAASFDVITVTFTLHHLYDPADLFALIQRCLRPGGFFFVLEYGEFVARHKAGNSQRRWVSRAGDGVRALLRWKNRRALAQLPNEETGFNSVHRPRSWPEIQQTLVAADEYALTQIDRGLLLPAFKRVLVDQAWLDRQLIEWLSRIDRRLVAHTGGYFQWIAGQRRAVRDPRPAADVPPPAGQARSAARPGSAPPTAR